MADSKKSPLEGYYLTRVWHPDAAPFKTVMDLSKDAAHYLTAQFTRHTCDDKDYIEERKKVESWLRENAAAAGVEIRKDHPVYFRLTQTARDSFASDKNKVISIPAGHLDLSAVSFTFDDSFHHLAPDKKHPCSKRVFSAEGVAAAIAEHGFLDTVSDPKAEPRYIEAQMWMELELSPLVSRPQAKPFKR